MPTARSRDSVNSNDVSITERTHLRTQRKSTPRFEMSTTDPILASLDALCDDWGLVGECSFDLYVAKPTLRHRRSTRAFWMIFECTPFRGFHNYILCALRSFCSRQATDDELVYLVTIKSCRHRSWLDCTKWSDPTSCTASTTSCVCMMRFKYIQNNSRRVRHTVGNKLSFRSYIRRISRQQSI